MPRFFFRWLVTSVTILALPYLFSGVAVRDVGAALVVAAVLGVLNAFVKPVLVILTLPLTFLSLGLFLLVINALLLEFAASLVNGIEIHSFWTALGAALVVSLVSSLASFGGDRAVIRTRTTTRSSSGTVDMHRNDKGQWE